MSKQNELKLRLRKVSLSLQSQHQQLTNHIQSDQYALAEQAKIINTLSSQNIILVDTNARLKQEIGVLDNKQKNLDQELILNAQLKERMATVQQMLALVKVETAIKESDILNHELQIKKLQSSQKEAQLTFQKDKQLEAIRAQARKRVYSITKTSSRYSDILHIQQNYSDNNRKQWIKTLKTKYSSRDQTVNTIKSKCKSLVKEYIPLDLRRLGWSELIQNRLSLTEQLYCYYYENKKIPQKVLFQIDKDIDRSFPDVSEIQKNFAVELKEIIEIFHCYRPDISYVQGMTYPAGVLLLILDKYKAWECFCNLILTTQVVYHMYVFDVQKIALSCRTFDFLLEQTQPKLWQKMKEQNIHSQIYLFEWFYTMFSRSFSIPTVFKIWDLLLFYGESILYQVGLIIFDQLKFYLMETDYEQSIEMIKNFQTKISEAKVLQDLSNSKLPFDKAKDAFQKVLRRNNIPSKMQ